LQYARTLRGFAPLGIMEHNPNVAKAEDAAKPQSYRFSDN
jgi:hypothetical protein